MGANHARAPGKDSMLERVLRSQLKLAHRDGG